MLKSFAIDDRIDDPHNHSIEVTVELNDGQRRWCFFMPLKLFLKLLIEDDHQHWYLFTSLHPTKALTQEGTRFDMTTLPRHMILVSEVSEAIITETLRQLDQQGLLKERTKLLRRRSHANKKAILR